MTILPLSRNPRRSLRPRLGLTLLALALLGGLAWLSALHATAPRHHDPVVSAEHEPANPAENR